MISDKEIDKIYNLITDFDDFQSLVIARKRIELSEQIIISFTSEDEVYVLVDNKLIKLSNKDFLSILRDFEVQKKSDKEVEILQREKLAEEKRANDLSEINDLLYKAESEFCEKFVYSRDIATGNSIYKRMLSKIITVFRKGGEVIFQDKIYTSEKEFIKEYLSKQYGFESLDKELGN